jgi:methionyl-tRNA formyltransferase
MKRTRRSPERESLMRIVYMGTPEFACPALEALAADPGAEIALVVTQPDRPAGRGRKLQPPPVKRVADELGLAVYQTPSLKAAGQREAIVAAQPDLIVVAAFGLILGRSVLEAAPMGSVNLHASLLPRYRGASPISAAILEGDATTGVTLMQMERGLDTGPMLASIEMDINAEDTTESLTPRLAGLAADLIVGSLPDLATGKLKAVPQPDGGSLTRPLVKADGWIDWTRPVVEVERLVRAMWSWPRAWTPLPSGEPLQIHRVSIVPPTGNAPGHVARDADGLVVACGDSGLRIERGQLPGGKPLDGAQLAQSRVLQGQVVLGAGCAPDTPGPMIRPISGPEDR